MTANVEKRAVACDEDNEHPVAFECKCGKVELPIVDRYTYLGVKSQKDCSWDAHIARAVGKSKTQEGEMDAILTDSHLGTTSKICILMSVIVPKVEQAGVWEGNAKSVKQLETVQMTAAKNVLGCPSTRRVILQNLRAALGIYPPKTNKRCVRKLK